MLRQQHGDEPICKIKGLIGHKINAKAATTSKVRRTRSCTIGVSMIKLFKDLTTKIFSMFRVYKNLI